MKRLHLFLGTTITILLLFVSATVIFAGTYRSPAKDTTCDGTNCSNGFGVYVQASGSPGGGPCQPTWVGYIGWDLSGETRTWQSASLKLTAYNVTGGQPPFTFKIYPANNDTWTEDGADPGYDSNTELASAVDDLTDNVVEFASDALGNYFLNKKGGMATIAVVMTDGCGAVSGTAQFEDREGSGGNAANEPDLVFWTGPVVNSTPTAVEMKSIRVEDNTPVSTNWPMIAGLFALGTAVLVGLGYGLRRSKQS
ncbi:MAG TPA: hypothetical protein ENK60_01495 [Anaerolineae bacterium]|nr:hypothetical protein [Anaerolineae bacterium]